MTKKLTILFAPVEGVGHVNACIGLAESLRDRGHKIVFAIDESFKGKLINYGFVEEILIAKRETNARNDGKAEGPGEQIANILVKSGLLSGISSLEKVKNNSRNVFLTKIKNKLIEFEPQMKAIINKHKPDVYIIDHFYGSPTLIHSDKPWVFLFSGNPLFVLDDERTPPGASGMDVLKI
jgi:hypothetical protein